MKKQFQINIALIVSFMFSATFSVEIANANHPRGGLDNGVTAPDFSLPDADNRLVTLSEYRGSENVVLIFYRGQW